jgi:hypothetical protein
MTDADEVPVTPKVQYVRSVLAELAESGHDMLGRERHLDVLLALDNLELAAHGAWPPPDAARNISDIAEALAGTRDALAEVLAELSSHDVDPVRVALAREHVTAALARTS